MARKEGVSWTNGEAPTLARFQPKDEYVSTFDMLHDSARNHAYSVAVRLQAEASSAGKETNSSDSTPAPFRCLDIGTGSGLLASLVAAASSSPPTSPGAKTPNTSTPSAATRTKAVEVYACEGVAEVADVAAETFKNNGGGVHLFRGRSTEMEVGNDLPSRVPLVLSELLGTGLLEEGILPTLRDAQARLLSPGYVSIPHSAEVWAFCCESAEFHHMSRLLPQAAAERGIEAFLPPSSEEWERCPGTASPASVRARFRPLSPSVKIFDFDLSSGGDPLPGAEGRRHDVRFPIDGGDGGTVHAVVCWWRCFMDEGRTVAISTSPLPPPEEPLHKHGPRETKGAPPEEQTARAAKPPIRDHWRESVYLLSRPLKVRAGDAVRALAHHDDTTVWFHAVERETQSIGSDRNARATADASCGAPALEGSQREENRASGAATTASAWPFLVGPVSTASDESVTPAPEEEKGRVLARDVVAREPRDGPEVPPVCVCGLHRTCPPSRIWMLNDQSRTSSFRSVIGAIIAGDSGHHLADGAEKQPNTIGAADTAATAAAAVATAGIKRRRKTPPVPACVACISDGFLLPLLAAQAGASEVLEIQPSAAYAAVCRDVYHANGVDVDVDADIDDDNRKDSDSRPRVIQSFPGGVSSVYDLLMPSPGPRGPPDNHGFSSSAGRKVDAVIGEPFFVSLSTATWPLESLLLFWCARTSLEAGGHFSPRTRVVPARARLLACPFACDLLFRGRRPVGIVEGVDMSAANHRLGLGRAAEPRRGPSTSRDEDDGGEDATEGVQTRFGGVESVRLSEYGHELLGSPTAVLDMDLTRPLCDLHSGRKEIRCFCGRRQPLSTPEAGGVSGPAPKQQCREAGSTAVCHGVALWLDILLDEEGSHRLSTGPEVPYWPQGVLFFEDGWVAPPGGASFHLEAALEDGALRVGVS